jgi:putative FmdB family regulatory protein
MPTYEYRCPSCRTEFEKFQRMSDEPVAECPSCGSAAERRLSAGAGLLFKGSGFYITDYRSDTYKKASQSEGGGPGQAGDAGKGGGPDKGAGAPKGGGSDKGGGSGASGPASSGKAD